MPAVRVFSSERGHPNPRSQFLAALGVVALLACGARPAVAPGEAAPVSVKLALPGDLREVTLQGSRVFGPSIEVLHRGQTYRGRAFNQPVDLRVDDGLVEGAVGGRTELHVQVEANSFTVRGLNASRLGGLEVGPDRIVGQLGGCQYDLVAAGGARYQGLRACSRRPEPAALSIAPEVRAMPYQDQAALLAILLTP